MQAWLQRDAIDVQCSGLPGELDKLPNDFDQSGFAAAIEQNGLRIFLKQGMGGNGIKMLHWQIRKLAGANIMEAITD